MDKITLIAKAVCMFLFLFCSLGIIVMLITEEDEEPNKTVYLTAEEWANRPVMPNASETEQVEAFKVEEPIEEAAEMMLFESVPLDAELQILAQELCKEYHVGFAFFLAMCESESSFNPEASGDGNKSKGLMQINRPNWERYGLDASMVSDNLEIGIRMMGELIEKYQEFDAVVMAYKGGEAKADQWIAEGFRLASCDELADRTIYWQEVIDKERTASKGFDTVQSNK